MRAILCAMALCLASCNTFGESWQEFQVDLSETLAGNAELQASINQKHQEELTETLDAYARGEMTQEEMRLRQAELNDAQLKELQEAFGLLAKETGEDLDTFKSSVKTDFSAIKEDAEAAIKKAQDGGAVGWLELVASVLGGGVAFNMARNRGAPGTHRIPKEPA